MSKTNLDKKIKQFSSSWFGSKILNDILKLNDKISKVKNTQKDFKSIFNTKDNKMNKDIKTKSSVTNSAKSLNSKSSIKSTINSVNKTKSTPIKTSFKQKYSDDTESDLVTIDKEDREKFKFINEHYSGEFNGPVLS